MSRFSLPFCLSLLALGVGCAPKASPSGAVSPPPAMPEEPPMAELTSLDAPLEAGQRQGFTPEVQAALEALLKAHGKGSPGYDPTNPPVAVFDWDNTVIRHDIGEAVFVDGLLEGFIKAQGSWAPEGWLSPEWKARLDAIPLDAEGGISPDHAEMLLGAYNGGFVEDPERNCLHRPYAWAALLLAGHTLDEVRAFTEAVADRRLGADIGHEVMVGSTATPGWMRLNPPMVALIRALDEAGVEVWIVSASAQPLVEVMGARIGIPKERVIGVRLGDGEGGLLLPTLAPAPAPCPEGEVMTWRAGKACYIRAVIGKAPILVAGDSVTDLEMLEMATGYRLVMDRSKEPLMTRARANEDGKWLVQGLFYP